MDHSNPDYSLDGRIVLANGLIATAVAGQASDAFPAYWSTTLRQYVSYDGHNGYDFELSYQPLLAAAAGTVEFAGWNSSDPYVGYGQMVLIDHHNGYATLYGHLSKLEVQTGDKVHAGQEIGVSGTTGRSSGPHLHFSVFHDCHVTDPYGWTGSKTDPLATFNGEHAGYLWLPEHDPLLVNPPPKWPSYPLGLRVVTPPSGVGAGTMGPRRVPPVDRLLLLSLPSVGNGHTVTTSVALARTEASITQEGEALVPQLDALQAQGLIDTYQIIPAAAAIWIRGTATADQLEGLAGTASLTGVRPKDIQAAQAGLAHAVLIQVGQQQTPSLWPVGFRSDLHVWRPVSTVMINHALVAGLARPGQRVDITLRRGGSVSATAETTSDISTGGFVAMLHDPQGHPVRTRMGDVIQIGSAGRTTRVRMPLFTLRARSLSVDGVGPSRTTFGLAELNQSGHIVTRVTTTALNGHFHVALDALLPAGGMSVASVADASGDQIAACAYVPGISVIEGGSIVRGWTVGQNPKLSVFRAQRAVFSRVVHPAPDGTFEVELVKHGAPWALHEGDVIQLGSRTHHRSVSLPILETGLALAVRHLDLLGPPGASVIVQYVPQRASIWSESARLDSKGAGRLNLLSGRAARGDAVSLRYVSAQGDIIEANSALDQLLVHQGSGVVTGYAAPGSVISLQGINGASATTASGIVNVSETTGLFYVQLHGMDGRKPRVLDIARMLVNQGTQSSSYRLPHLSVRLHPSRQLLTARGPVSSPILVEVHFAGKPAARFRLATDRSGRASRVFNAREFASIRRIVISWGVGHELAVEQTVDVPGLRAPTCPGERKPSTALTRLKASRKC